MTVIDDLRSRIAEGSAGVIVGPGVSVAATQGNHVANWVGLLRSGISWSEDNVPATPAGWPAVVRGLLDLGDVSSLVSAAAMLTERLGGREGGEYRVWLRKTIGSMTLVNAAVPEALVAAGLTTAHG